MFVKELDILDLISDAQEQYQKYSAPLFDNGTFWEQKGVQDKFLYNQSASKKLIEGLKSFRNKFVEQNANVDRSFVHKILVQSILVKYLEERRDKSGNGVFEKDFFTQFEGASNFCEVIRKGHIVTLFDILSVHFNGKIFELDEDEKPMLAQLDLSSLANFLDANLDDQQYVMWRLYAFDYLPVELISRIYEEFVMRPDAVYTPMHLARFMVDECMPLDAPQDDYKIIDVSCGSGIFLVTAFKRLVQWWQKQHYIQTGKIERPDTNILQSILSKSIYGVDIEPEAIQLSVFSLSIALCDILDPTEVWLKLKFNNLVEQNLYTGNFFQYLSEENTKGFDLVIGNPPFKEKNEEVPLVIEKYNLQADYGIPRDEIALLFLQQAMFLLKESSLLCLVMPAGPLIYNNTLNYRREFFSKYEIPQIVDLSALSKKGYLFESTVSTAVIFVQSQVPPKTITFFIPPLNVQL